MLSVAVVAAVLAQPANPYLEEAQRLARGLRFTEAIERLEVARAVPGLTAEQRHELVELLGRCHVAVGNRAAAVETFTAALREDPRFTLDRSQQPPKVLEAFDEAKRALYPDDYVRIDERPAPAGRAEVRLVDPWGRVARLVKHERRGEAWAERALSVDGAGSASFALVLSAGERAEWYLEALAADGTVLARLGEAEHPRVVTSLPVEVVAGLAPRPGLGPRKTAGVVVAGVGVVALGVGVGLLVSSLGLRRAARDPSRPPGDFADTARAAEASGVAQGTAAIILLAGGGAVAVTGGGLALW